MPLGPGGSLDLSQGKRVKPGQVRAPCLEDVVIAPKKKAHSHSMAKAHVATMSSTDAFESSWVLCKIESDLRISPDHSLNLDIDLLDVRFCALDAAGLTGSTYLVTNDEY
jgi:hypothetical protein